MIGNGQKLSVFHDQWIPKVDNPNGGRNLEQVFTGLLWSQFFYPAEVAQKIMALYVPMTAAL